MILHDLRHALRGLIRRPLFAAVAVLSLALGIGATTSLVSVVDALLLRPPSPIPDAGRLVEVGRGDDRGGGFDTFSYPDFEALHGAPAFEALSEYAFDAAAFTNGGAGTQILAATVSPSYFPMMGVAPLKGRLFQPSEAAPWDAHPVAVLSYRFWRDRLGADPEVVGSTIQVNRHTLTVVGVLPAAFRGHTTAFTPDVYLPISMVRVVKPGFAAVEDPNAHWMMVLGRLAPGATLASARVQARGVFDRLRLADPRTYAHKTVDVRPYGAVPAALRGPVQAFLAIIGVLVALVLLVACANVAGMLLARAADREKELAVRAALGASRAGLVWRMLLESLLLFAVGGALGLLLAVWLTGALAAVRLPIPVPLHFDFAPNLAVLGAGLALALGTGVVAGLVPALRAVRPDLVPALRDDAGTGGLRSGRLRRAFVTAQVGLSLVLLVAAGLFLRSLQGAAAIPKGFDPRGVHLASFDLRMEGYDDASGLQFVDGLLQRVRAIPGVTDAAVTRDLPLDLASWGTPYWKAGTWDGTGRPPYVGSDINVVTPGYFAALRMPVLEGRAFNDADDARATPVVVVSRTLAEKAWPQVDPIGQRLVFDDSRDTQYTVIGVVEDVQNQFLTGATEPMAYRVLAQAYAPQVTLVARSTPGVAGVPAALRRAVLAGDPSLTLTPVMALTDYTAVGLLPQRLAASVATALGLLALFLAALGIYGVVAYAFARRTREIGLRLALGAAPGDLRRLVASWALRLALPGLLAGCVLAAATSFLVRGLLIRISPLDPVTFVAVTLALLVAVAAAAAVPARRAAAVQPMEAMRQE